MHYTHSMKHYLFSKAGNLSICDNMDRTGRHHIKIIITERWMIYGFIYTKSETVKLINEEELGSKGYDRKDLRGWWRYMKFQVCKINKFKSFDI